MFDLEHEIEIWKAPFLRRHIYSSRDVSELEMHLRDALTDELGRGWSEEYAFRVAVSRVGDEAQLRDQFEQNWKELNPLVAYVRSLSAEFRGWSTNKSLITYSIARVVSGLVGYTLLVLALASIFSVVLDLLRGEPVSGFEKFLPSQGVFFLSVLFFTSAFNIFPFRQWDNRWTDWLRLCYTAIVILDVCIFVLFSPQYVAGLELIVYCLLAFSLALGPVLWLKQVFRRRDYHPDLDSLVAGN